jgi:malate dehydrogenase (oxaloacetate-decarboxylating)(NADP+)
VFADNLKIFTSAVALSKTINQHELDEGRLYPNVTRIREVSVVVAREIIRQAQKEGLDREKSIRGLSDAELDSWIQSKMYDPEAQDGLERRQTASPRVREKSFL